MGLELNAVGHILLLDLCTIPVHVLFEIVLPVAKFVLTEDRAEDKPLSLVFNQQLPDLQLAVVVFESPLDH